jgi:hypothetical protein
MSASQPYKLESSVAQVHQPDCSLSIAPEKGKSGQRGNMTSSSEGRHHHILFEIQKHCLTKENLSTFNYNDLVDINSSAAKSLNKLWETK